MMTIIRPASLNEFVGQENTRRIVRVLITAAKRRGEPVPHVLMSGSAGLGKTTLARIIAAEMGGRLVEMIGSAVKNVSDMTAHLMQLQVNDVLFFDEIHALPHKIEEVLYSAMEDGLVSTCERGYDELVKQLGIHGSKKAVRTHHLPPFTLVGATTLLGLCTAPLRSRFRQIIELEPYTDADLARIVCSAAGKLDFVLHVDIAAEIARRSRGTARTAINHLQWYRDYVQADGGIPTMEALGIAFKMKGIDGQGLTRTDRDYLKRLLESDEPLGIETLATMLNESVETIEESIEPFLLRQGLIQRTPRGRIVTETGKQLLTERIA